MNPNEEHLSMFELDLFFASNTPDARIEGHVAACQRCSAYLSELALLQASTPCPAPLQAPLPPSRPAPRPSSIGRRRPRALHWTLAAGLAVLGAVTALLVVDRDADAPAVAVKGSPAVQLLIRRDEKTRAWDGASRVRAGDALGLRVACEGFRRVTVAAASRDGGWAALSEGACPEADGALPFTLVVDDAPGGEQLAVVFSEATLDPRVLGDAIAQRRLDAGAWVTRFELAKETTP
jgi:hypothetical protein